MQDVHLLLPGGDCGLRHDLDAEQRRLLLPPVTHPGLDLLFPPHPFGVHVRQGLLPMVLQALTNVQCSFLFIPLVDFETLAY